MTVASDTESPGVNSYSLVVDCEGIAVDSAVAGRKLTAEKLAEDIKETKIEEKVKHSKLIIPSKAARLSGEIEEFSGWESYGRTKRLVGDSKIPVRKWGSQAS